MSVTSTTYSFRRLFFRSLLPSSTSLAISFVVALALIIMQVIMSSLHAGRLFPHLFGQVSDQWIGVYTQNVLNPLERVFDSTIGGSIAVGLLWAIIGLIIYGGLAFAVASISEVRRDNEEIRVSAEGLVTHHPLRSTLIARTVWRMTIGICVIIATALLIPFIATLPSHSEQIVHASSMLELFKHAAIALGGWVAVFHIYIVLLRLFMFRTRLFGEVIDQ
ncbi:MAG TPA: hypothetical protein VLA92_01880 [Candidatus Saccharimonadales bacterium]|nr:hypothetical protein [Candidatus Saccharimonadales bacterium]